MKKRAVFIRGKKKLYYRLYFLGIRIRLSTAISPIDLKVIILEEKCKLKNGGHGKRCQKEHDS